ncbi:hypothetical protein HC031_15845 [Planosporangium thailandense]|uniref:Glycosyl hydrolase family 98 putative carbohydrate-binding module domain-containing protein n=1 Tax=Planosporangium thailandense TaxID=765197 RepID=A0ABX0XYQ7_9ACTN|nr:NPCBM/NEW2 domain-containing protein [Planosporangium thailandense]NJC71173.1 hypothetical protein [Planosporangium thailandense]
MTQSVLIAAGLALLSVLLGFVGGLLPQPAKVTTRGLAAIFAISLVLYVVGTAYKEYSDKTSSPPSGEGSGEGSTAQTPMTAPDPAPPATPSRTPSPRPEQGQRSSVAIQVTDDPGLGPQISHAPPNPEYLSTIDYVNSSGDTMVMGDASIRNQPYKNSVSLCADGPLAANRCANFGHETWVEYNIDPHYTTLTATIGMSSNSSSDCQLYGQVLIDNDEVFGKQFAFGDQYPFTQKVTGKLRIRLQMHAVGGHGRCDLVFGNVALKK